MGGFTPAKDKRAKKSRMENIPVVKTAEQLYFDSLKKQGQRGYRLGSKIDHIELANAYMEQQVTSIVKKCKDALEMREKLYNAADLRKGWGGEQIVNCDLDKAEKWIQDELQAAVQAESEKNPLFSDIFKRYQPKNKLQVEENGVKELSAPVKKLDIAIAKGRHRAEELSAQRKKIQLANRKKDEAVRAAQDERKKRKNGENNSPSPETGVATDVDVAVYSRSRGFGRSGTKRYRRLPKPTPSALEKVVENALQCHTQKSIGPGSSEQVRVIGVEISQDGIVYQFGDLAGSPLHTSQGYLLKCSLEVVHFKPETYKTAVITYNRENALDRIFKPTHFEHHPWLRDASRSL